MGSDRFDYAAEKFAVARSSLMAPHPEGEESAFASAFHTCSLALHRLDASTVTNEQARIWITTIRRLMDTRRVEDTTGEGTYLQRARAMTFEERREFSNAVDELASWFERGE